MQQENYRNSTPVLSKQISETPTPTNKSSTHKQKRIILEYNSELIVHVVFKKSDEKKLTCGWLFKEGINNMKAIAEKKKIQRDFSKIIAFTTKSKDLLIDYWLTLSEENLSLIDDGTVLVPYFKTKSRAFAETTTSNDDQDIERHARLADFEFITLIGKGGFSKVFLARKKENGRFYAVKKILKGDKKKFEKEKRGIQRERNAMTELKFPSFVQLHYSFQTEKNYYFVMDYIPGGDLYHHLRQNIVFCEEDVKFYIAQVLVGLNTLHTNNFIHRDLKPENLLLDLNGHLHFADFGLTKVFKRKSDYHYTFCGTPEYMAPEVITGAGYNILADYYSLGSLAYELVVGVPPFQRVAGNNKEIFKNVVVKKPTMPTKISEEGRSFISSLLEKKPHERLGAKEGYKELVEHPWFAGVDFTKVASRTSNAPIKIDPKGLLLASVKNQVIDDCDDDVLEAKINDVDNLKVSGFSYFSVSDVGSPQLFQKRQMALKMLLTHKSVKPGGAEETVASVLKTPKIVSPHRGIRQLLVPNAPLQVYTNTCKKPVPSNKKTQLPSIGLVSPTNDSDKLNTKAKAGFNDYINEWSKVESNELSYTSSERNLKTKNYCPHKGLKLIPLGLTLSKVTEEEATPKRLAPHNELKLIADERSPINFRNY